jgi:hypothetical protein
VSHEAASGWTIRDGKVARAEFYGSREFERWGSLTEGHAVPDLD